MTTTTLPGGTFTLADDLDPDPHRLRRDAAGRPAASSGRRRTATRRSPCCATVVELGINHIDTSDFYGPHVTNEIIREALHPYPDDLHLVTKVGARRDAEGGWPPARSPEELRQAVHDNLRTPRPRRPRRGQPAGRRVRRRPSPGSIAEPFAALAELQQQGLIRHLGVSTVNAEQVAEAQAIAPVVCVQNFYNLAHRDDDALIDALAGQGIAYVPYFPLGGFSPLQSDDADGGRGRASDATPMAVALAWLLHRSPNILLIPGTSSVAHLRENVAGAGLELPADTLAELDGIAG